MSLDERIDTPVTFTDAAVKALQTFDHEPGLVLRIGVKGGGCTGFLYDLAFDDAREYDHHYTHNGVAYVIDPVSERYVHGTVLDYITGLQGFHFHNPNAIGSCGCGKSFNVE